MLTLDYRIHRDASADDVAWDRIDDVSLGYWCFLGDIVLTTDDADLSMRWGWLPILGFALQMKNAAHVIQRGEPYTLEILGSDRCLHFTPRGNRIKIVTDDSEGAAFVSPSELVEASDQMLSRLRADVEGRHPGLLTNRRYRDLLSFDPEYPTRVTEAKHRDTGGQDSSS
ncbi:hypothetical protein [Microbacterium paraoxydans]|uniref:hypothetical protein n=1 Tax=Microbacterium paraoxydans TaxID=199592 RepID=UPI003D726D27